MSWANLPDMDPATYRLFQIIRCIADHPGITFKALKQALPQRWANATLHKDLRILKDMGILDDRRHRSGYYVGRMSLTHDDVPLLLAGLQVLGHDLRHPVKREGFARLVQRLAIPEDAADDLTYPTVAIGHRVIVETLHTDMRDLMDVLTEMIRSGRHITIRQVSNPWPGQSLRTESVYPLQVIFHDVAWYLLADRGSHDFIIYRLDRLSPVISHSGEPSRDLTAQRQALQEAHRRLHHAWGLRMPPDTDDIVDHTIRFSPDVASFIREAPRRHPAMTLADGIDDQGQTDGSVIMGIRLHESSLEAFSWWVLSWGGRATVIGNDALHRRVREQAEQILSQSHTRKSDSAVAEPP